MIVRWNVTTPIPSWSEPNRALTNLEELWKIHCPACGMRVDPVRWATENWHVMGNWTDGHVEIFCPPCGLRGVHAFDLSPIARFPSLAAKLAGVELDQLEFSESLTTELKGIDERKQRERVWTGGGATIRLRHGYETNYPPNEMQWYYNNNSGGSISATGLELSIGDDLKKVSIEDPVIGARWQSLLEVKPA